MEAAKAPRLPDRREAHAPDVDGFIQWYVFFWGAGSIPCVTTSTSNI